MEGSQDFSGHILFVWDFHPRCYPPFSDGDAAVAMVTSFSFVPLLKPEGKRNIKPYNVF